MLKKEVARPCKYCGGLFVTKSPQRRKFCCLSHQRSFNMARLLKSKIAAGEIPPDDWRVGLVKSLERKMQKAREETAKKLGISVEELERMIEAFEAQPNANAQPSNKERRGDNYGRQN